MPRASPIIEAVRSAVPDGASILFAWCSSMISAESKNRAAWAAKRIISTAPTEKFGAMSTRPPGAAASQERTSASRSSPKPEVPTTTVTPCSIHQRRLSITAATCVKSTTTSQPSSGSSGSPWSTCATSSVSGASCTVSQTVRPIRPLAPRTPTLIITPPVP